MKKRIHNWLLKFQVVVAVIGFVLGGLALDSISWLPTIVCGVCLAFLAVFVFVNRKEFERWI